MAVLTCTHDLCFSAKITKIIPLLTTDLLYQSGIQRGRNLHGCVNMMFYLE